MSNAQGRALSPTNDVASVVGAYMWFSHGGMGENLEKPQKRYIFSGPATKALPRSFFLVAKPLPPPPLVAGPLKKYRYFFAASLTE